MLLGEGPGGEEDQAGKPFVGGSGRILGRWFYEAGTFRGEVHVDNVFSHRPPNNNLDAARPNKFQAYAALHDRIRRVNPRVIVAAGETPLEFFGKQGISNWRGSCFEWNGIKVVPTFHPAFIMRVPDMWRFCVEDLRFAFRKAETWPTSAPVYYTINPPASQFDAWCRAIPDGSEVSIDLETTMDFGATTHVGLAYKAREATVIDMEEEYLLPLLRLLKRPMQWVGQNVVMFDSIRLHELGAPLLTATADIMLAHHLLQSPAPHDLGFINSCYTRYPYFKDESGKDIHRYCAKDTDSAWQIWQMMKHELVAEGMWDLFQVVMKAAHYVRAMRMRGVPVDRQLVVEAAKQLELDSQDVMKQIREKTGMKYFNPRSWVDCRKVLYETLKLPVQYNQKGRERKITTDDDALVKLSRHPGNNGIPQLILACRRPLNDLSKYFRPETIDRSTGRWHPDWKIHGTETGRYSCWFHTLPPRVRHVVRQPGRLIAYVDAQQGEFRIASWCADDSVGKEIQERPGGVHNNTATVLFSKIKGYQVKLEEVTPMMRFYTKFTVFGWIYGREPPSIAEQYNIPLDAAKEITGVLATTFKRIVIWKADTAATALSRGMLRNPYGRRRYFDAGSDADKEREAYAFLPQSTLHDIVQRAHILVEESEPYREEEVVADMHDALVMVVHEGFDPDGLRSLLSREYLPGLRMPFDVEVNPYWHDKRAEEDAKGKVVL